MFSPSVKGAPHYSPMLSAVESWRDLDQKEHALSLSLGLASMKALLGGRWNDGESVKKETRHLEGQSPG